ncbi:hypothetical protein LO762_26745 [Actinocorallia sp. API 0066]|uniref:hypothetical protein n=1 Tax=Actinocorallia sp. API 0066 TaxID=2896846 RepID=UPI001E4ECA82|nr:hypothetical protein [Actinocorallia sp. API 0066]MCD0452753.1 hypothetical protein [Actinocorallia sp. API 0066]
MRPTSRFGTALATAALVLTATPAVADDPPDPTAAPSPTTGTSASPSPTSTSKAPGDDDGAETPTAAPTDDEPTQEPPAAPPVLYIALTLPQATLAPGDQVTATVHVYATEAVARAARLALSATGGVELSPTCTLAAGACNLGDVTAAGDFVPVRLTVPATAAAGQVRLTTTASATGAADRTVVHLLTVAPKASPSPSAPATPSSTPTPTPSQPPSTPPPVVPPAVVPPVTVTPFVPPADAGGAPPGALPPADPTEGFPQVLDSTTRQPYTMSVSTIRPDTSADPVLTSLVRAQAVWLGVLFAVVGLLFARARRTPAVARGAHRRPGRGRFAR